MYLSATRKGSAEWRFAYVVRVWSIVLILATAIAAPAFGQAVVNFDTGGCAGKLGAKCERNFGPVEADVESVTVKAAGWYCTGAIPLPPDALPTERTDDNFDPGIMYDQYLSFFQGERPNSPSPFGNGQGYAESAKTVADDKKTFDEKARAVGYNPNLSVTEPFGDANEIVVNVGLCYTKQQVEKLLEPMVAAAKEFCERNPRACIAGN